MFYRKHVLTSTFENHDKSNCCILLEMSRLTYRLTAWDTRIPQLHLTRQVLIAGTTFFAIFLFKFHAYKFFKSFGTQLVDNPSDNLGNIIDNIICSKYCYKGNWVLKPDPD
jgi:hypothetical protein